VPDWLVTLIGRCLQKKPEDRFENGIALQEFIQHHRIYTAEVASLVKNEDDRWKSVLAEKNDEVQDLRAIIARQDKELQMVRQKNGVVAEKEPDRNTVPRATFHALLFALLVVGALAVYGLFFQRPVVSGANAETESFRDEDTLAAKPEQNNTALNKKTVAIEKAEEKKPPKRNDTTATAKAVMPPKEEKKDMEQAVDPTTVTEPDSTDTENKADDQKEPEKKVSGKTVKYKVRNRAYFYNEPTADTKREAFITHWDAPVKALDEKNGYIYVVFTNEEGQTTKGWISKDDLIPVK